MEAILDSSELYTPVAIEKKSVVRGADYGEEQITWVPFLSHVWANVVDQAGVESVRADQRVMVRRVQVTLRWRAGITTDMRVRTLQGSRVMQIISAIELPRRIGLQLLCEEYSV